MEFESEYLLFRVVTRTFRRHDTDRTIRELYRRFTGKLCPRETVVPGVDRRHILLERDGRRVLVGFLVINGPRPVADHIGCFIPGKFWDMANRAIDRIGMFIQYRRFMRRFAVTLCAVA